MTALALPPEPVVLKARLAFADTQAELTTPTASTLGTLYDCGWFGTAHIIDRGCFAIVDPAGPLADLVGDTLRLRNWRTKRTAAVYVVGSLSDMPTPIAIARRPFLAFEALTAERAQVEIEILR